MLSGEAVAPPCLAGLPLAAGCLQRGTRLCRALPVPLAAGPSGPLLIAPVCAPAAVLSFLCPFPLIQVNIHVPFYSSYADQFKVNEVGAAQTGSLSIETAGPSKRQQGWQLNRQAVQRCGRAAWPLVTHGSTSWFALGMRSPYCSLTEELRASSVRLRCLGPPATVPTSALPACAARLQAMRTIYEPLFLHYGVDLVLSGHVHSESGMG